MRQFFVTSEKTPTYETFRQHVTSAFETGEHMLLHGAQQSVPVEFDLIVHNVALRSGSVAKIIEFSGVVMPDGDLYHAEFHELRDNAPITLNIYRSGEV